MLPPQILPMSALVPGRHRHESLIIKRLADATTCVLGLDYTVHTAYCSRTNLFRACSCQCKPSFAQMNVCIRNFKKECFCVSFSEDNDNIGKYIPCCGVTCLHWTIRHVSQYSRAPLAHHPRVAPRDVTPRPGQRGPQTHEQLKGSPPPLTCDATSTPFGGISWKAGTERHALVCAAPQLGFYYLPMEPFNVSACVPISQWGQT